MPYTSRPLGRSEIRLVTSSSSLSLQLERKEEKGSHFKSIWDLDCTLSLGKNKCLFCVMDVRQCFPCVYLLLSLPLHNLNHTFILSFQLLSLLLCYNTLWNQFESQVEFLAMTPDNIELQLLLTDGLR